MPTEGASRHFQALPGAARRGQADRLALRRRLGRPLPLRRLRNTVLPLFCRLFIVAVCRHSAVRRSTPRLPRFFHFQDEFCRNSAAAAHPIPPQFSRCSATVLPRVESHEARFYPILPLHAVIQAP